MGLNPTAACKLKNLTQLLRGRKVFFQYSSKDNAYLVNDTGEVQFFKSRLRGFVRYSEGIRSCGEAVAESYFIDKIDFDRGDVVIDCGANYADLYVYFKSRSLGIRYIAIEPGPEEYACCLKNAAGQEVFNLALSNITGKADFYLSSAAGDSSLFIPAVGYTSVLTVQTERLDQFAKDIGKIKLLKLEAEGGEPEILEGGMQALKRIEYVAVDGGPERGPNGESTIERITNILISNGFEMLYMNTTGVGRALFRNLQLDNV